MSVDIKLEKCKFCDQASVIQTYFDNSNIVQLQSEIKQARDQTNDKEMIAALSALNAAVAGNNKTTVGKVIKDFAVQFSSNLFASIAGVALKAFIGTFLA